VRLDGLNLMLAPGSPTVSGKLLYGFAAVFAGVAALETWPQLAIWLAPFNRMTAAFTAVVIRWSGMEVAWEGTWLDHPGGFGLDIGYSCTALVPIAVITVFILAHEKNLPARLSGILLGSTIALAVNFFRLVALFYIGVREPQWLDQTHLLGQGLIMVSTVAFLWYWIHFSAQRRERRAGAAAGGSRQARLPRLSNLFRWFAASLLILTGAPAIGGGPGEIMAGEVVVKFVRSSPLNHSIQAATAKGLTGSPDLNAQVELLSEQLNIPITAQRLTSGGELVIGLGVQDVLNGIAAKIEPLPDVEQVEVRVDPGNNPFNRRDEVIISFKPGSDAFRTWQDAEKTGREQAVSRLLQSLQQPASSQLSGRLLPDGRVAVAIDFYTMTRELAQKLNGLSEVEYAQPNYIMRPNK